MKKLSFGICTLILLLLILGVKAQKSVFNQPANFSKKQEVHFPAASKFLNNKITYKIIPAVNQIRCYDILSDGKMMIHQYLASGLSGNQGFDNKVAEQKAADLVMQKKQFGEMLPSITKEHMQKIGTL